MESEKKDVAPLQVTEVPLVEAEVVRRMKVLAEMGWGAKRIARELEIARNTVKRYLKGGAAPGVQLHLKQRKLDAAERAKAVALFDGEAEGNAVVVHELLSSAGIEAGIRTVQRAVEDHRRSKQVAELATVRFETGPGEQMQIDFGEKRVRIGGQVVVVHLFVAVLSYSRRIFVKAFLRERQDDWFEGITGAFKHFGGVPRVILNDNPKSLIQKVNQEAGTVVLAPRYAALCRDWDVTPKACRPYRARTKGKTESGVKYAKRNAVAGRVFESFAALEAHLAAWMARVDQRVHGTTHEQPSSRFEREEKRALRPLPANPLPVRERRLQRKVANDLLVNVDTVRYSVPHKFVQRVVEVAIELERVRIFAGGKLIAEHRRSNEPHAKVVDPSHYYGLLRPANSGPPEGGAALVALGRSLEAYADVLRGEAA